MDPCTHRLQEGLGRATSPGKCLQRLDDFLGWVHLWKTHSSPLSPPVAHGAGSLLSGQALWLLTLCSHVALTLEALILKPDTSTHWASPEAAGFHSNRLAQRASVVSGELPGFRGWVAGCREPSMLCLLSVYCRSLSWPCSDILWLWGSRAVDRKTPGFCVGASSLWSQCIYLRSIRDQAPLQNERRVRPGLHPGVGISRE